MLKKQPLAYRIRPQSIHDVIGQEQLLGEGELLRRMIDANQLGSMILYYPPGTGKTSIARAIAGTMNLPFKLLNAVMHNKKDMETLVAEAKMHGQMIAIMDEVHRLDKTKQDFLLPHLENGLIIMIGATTSNPYHAINPAIRSRCHIFELTPLEPVEIKKALIRAVQDPVNGYGNAELEVDDAALDHLAAACGGDARSALNGLEVAILSTPKPKDGFQNVSLSK